MSTKDHQFEFKKFDDDIDLLDEAEMFYTEEVERATKYIRNLEAKFAIAKQVADLHIRVEDTDDFYELVDIAVKTGELTTQWREINK